MTDYRSRHFDSIAHKREFKRQRSDRLQMLRRDLLRWGGGALAVTALIRPSAAQILQFSGVSTGGGGGGYRDDDWPDASNRPTVSGSTMTWVGPLGGGPNNGNPQRQSVSLTPSSITGSSANGQIIQGLDITLDNLRARYGKTCVLRGRACFDPALGLVQREEHAFLRK